MVNAPADGHYTQGHLAVNLPSSLESTLLMLRAKGGGGGEKRTNCNVSIFFHNELLPFKKPFVINVRPLCEFELLARQCGQRVPHAASLGRNLSSEEGGEDFATRYENICITFSTK